MIEIHQRSDKQWYRWNGLHWEPKPLSNEEVEAYIKSITEAA